MSVDASIDIKLARKDNKKILAVDLIESLIKGKWRVYNNKKIGYIPLGDKDDFDWQYDELEIDEFKKIVIEKEKAKETIAVTMFWKNTDIGVHLMIFSQFEISFSLCYNKKILKTIKSGRVTDVNWYIERIIRVLEEQGYLIEILQYSQY